MIFDKKLFLMLCFIYWPNFVVWLPLLFEMSGNMVIVIVRISVCDIKNFETYLLAVFLTNKRSQEKNINISWTKKAFKMKWKVLFIIFERFHWSKQKHFFQRWESHFDLNYFLGKSLFRNFWGKSGPKWVLVLWKNSGWNFPSFCMKLAA